MGKFRDVIGKHSSTYFCRRNVNMSTLSNVLRTSARCFVNRSLQTMPRSFLRPCTPCCTMLSKDYSIPRTHEQFRDLTKAEWEKRLTPEQYSVCQEQCTEPPFSGEYNSHFEPGMYSCVCCDTELFSSEKKYDSGTGWPSFSAAAKRNGRSNVILRPENRVEHTPIAMVRTEVICKQCDSHLGHVFDDDTNSDTGHRYCINSIALKFTPA